MKTIKTCLLTVFLALASLSGSANAAPEQTMAVPTESVYEPSVITLGPGDNTRPDRSERKALRKKARESSGGGVYISVGAVIIIILLLIILL